MSTEDGFVANVIGALSRALSPLVDATASADALGVLLTRLGWTTPPPAAVVDAFAGASDAIDRLANHVASPAGASTLIPDVVDAIRAIAALESKIDGAAGPPFDTPDFWTSLPGDLVALLLHDDLRANAPGLYGLLSLAGAFRVESRAPNASIGRAAYEAIVLDVKALGRTAARPANWLEDVYGWGRRFDHARFITALADLADGLGTLFRRTAPPTVLIQPYVSAANPDRGRIELLSVSPIVVQGPTLADVIKPALIIMPIPPAGEPATPPDGLLLLPMVTGTAQATVDLGPAARLQLDGDFQLTPARVEIHPDRARIERSDLDAAFAARVDITPPEPFVIVGTTDGARFQLGRAHLSLGVDGSEVSIEAGLDDATAVLSLGSADSFLRGVLGEGSAFLPLSVVMTWSSESGLRFSGSATPSFSLPIDVEIANIVAVSRLEVSIGSNDADACVVTVAIDGSFTLGPFALIVEALGLSLELSPRELDDPGNFGPLDVSLALRPPTGFGMSLDLEGILSGGGFLSIDNGRYAGTAALQVFGVGISVVGIIQTELPGNPNGWSLFLSVIADFTPLPLGFGFFLSGIGGFMGLNRTLDEIALAAGVRAGRIDSLLFSEDPLADAPRILADIDAYFPTLEGTHSFGVMVRIDWGVPALISGELGIVLVVPDFRIAVVGEIESILPTPDAPLIELHMGVAGYIDPAEGIFWVTASIYDSRLVQYSLSGEMAMYVSVGERPYFLLSVGGYHPHWKRPASVPSSMRRLRRMTAAIDLGEDLQVGLDAYFAITSNTLQFGASVFAVARAREIGVDFSVEGDFGFDVLATFSPFSILATMHAHVAVKVEGATLFSTRVTLRLEGPKPWFGRATATFEYLGVPVRFRVAIGGAIDDEKPDAIDVWEELQRALHDVASWSVPAIPDGVIDEVTLRELDPVVESGLWLEPDGTIEVRQRVVPLNRTIDMFGEYVPAGESRFDVDAAGLVTAQDTDWTAVSDWFAPGQFVAMSDDDRLSAPSFEEMDAGVSLAAPGFSLPATARDLAEVTIGYQELILDAETEALGTRPLDAARLGAPSSSSRGARTPAGRRAVDGIPRLRVAAPRYRTVGANDAAPLAGAGTGTFVDALAAKRRKQAAGVQSRIVPSHAVRERAA